MSPPLATCLAALGLPYSAIRAFAAALKGVAAAGIRAAVPSLALYFPTGKVATLYLLHLRFSCRVAVDGDLPPIYEAVARVKGSMERLATLNQALMRVLTSCFRVF